MFVKYDDEYKLIYWQKFGEDYFVCEYNSESQQQLKFYYIETSNIFGVHAVYNLERLDNGKYRRDMLLSLINSKELSYLSNCQNYKLKEKAISKMVSNSDNIIQKPCDFHNPENEDTDIVSKGKKHKFSCKMCKLLEQEFIKNKNIKNYRMDKIKLKYPYAKRKSFLKKQLELIGLNDDKYFPLGNLIDVLFY